MLVHDLHHMIFTSNRLIEELEDFGLKDWDLSSCMCKTLWNFSDTLTLSVLCFDMEETDLIAKQEMRRDIYVHIINNHG